MISCRHCWEVGAERACVLTTILVFSDETALGFGTVRVNGITLCRAALVDPIPAVGVETVTIVTSDPWGQTEQHGGYTKSGFFFTSYLFVLYVLSSLLYSA